MAKALAKDLNYIYIDTGAMYRAATLFCLKERLIEGNEVNEVGIERAIDRLYVSFKFNPKSESSEVHLGGVSVEKEARSMEVARHVSLVAAVPVIRRKMVMLQKRMAAGGGVVMDGRDIGTVVIPDAKLKFFITADAEIRAQRRLNELQREGVETTLADVLSNIVERDRIDSSRSVAPLRQAEGAVVLDNSQLTVEEQFEFLLNHARKAVAVGA